MSTQKLYNADSCEYESINTTKQSKASLRSKVISQRTKLFQYLVFGVGEAGHISSYVLFNSELLELILHFATGTQKDIDFLSKTIIISKEKWASKNTLSILALVILSTSDKDYAKGKFKSIFKTIIKTETDLIEFMEFIKTGSIRGFGKIIQYSLKEWFNDLTPYNALKFSQTYTHRDGGRGMTYTIADILKLSHVKAKNNEQNALFKWLLTKKVTTDLHSSIKAAMEYKSSTVTSAQKISLAENNNIPIDFIKRVKSSADAYSNILTNLTFEEIISNFTTLSKKGVFKNKDSCQYVIDLLTSENVIENSKVLPHQFFELYDQNTSVNLNILNALETAGEYAYSNLPIINKKITLFIDQGQQTLKSSATSESEIGFNYTFATFSAIISKMASDCRIYTFDNAVKKIEVNTENDTLTVSDQIVNKRPRKETNQVKVIKYLKENNHESDIIIFLTTGERWTNILRSTEAGSELSNYLNSCSEQPRLIFVNSNDINEQFTHTLPKTDFITGWNDRNLKYLIYLLQIDDINVDDMIK